MFQQASTPQQTQPEQFQKELSRIGFSRFRDRFSGLQSLDVSTSTSNDPKRNSSRLDSLLYSSFVEIDRFVQRQQQTFNLESVESFFKKSNNFFFPESNKKSCPKMSHKKIQCQIGRSSCLAESETRINLANKLKTLQILKMAKLIKLIFKQLRSNICTVKKQVQVGIRQAKKVMALNGSIFLDKVSIIGQQLDQKCSKIRDLERQIELLSEENERLKQDLETQVSKNRRLLDESLNQSEKNTIVVNKLQDEKEQKIAELAEKIYSLQKTQSMLQEEISNLNEIISENESQLNRLQYEKQALQDENSDLARKNEVLMKKHEQNESSYNCENADDVRNSQDIHELIRINETYLKEIQSCKAEIQRLKEENRDIQRQSEIYIAQQLQNLGEYFQQRYTQLQSYYNKNAKQPHDLCRIFQVQPFERQDAQKKRKISVLTFRQNISSLKKRKETVQLSAHLSNCLLAEKQNKHTLVSIKAPKHLSQQINELIMLQSKQNQVLSEAISSSGHCEEEQNFIFKQKLQNKGQLKLLNVALSSYESPKSQCIKISEIRRRQQKPQPSKVRKGSIKLIAI